MVDSFCCRHVLRWWTDANINNWSLFVFLYFFLLAIVLHVLLRFAAFNYQVGKPSRIKTRLFWIDSLLLINIILTFYWNCFFFILQVVLLQREYKPCKIDTWTCVYYYKIDTWTCVYYYKIDTWKCVYYYNNVVVLSNSKLIH